MANKTSTFLDNNPPKADSVWLNMVTTEIKNLVPIDGSTIDSSGTNNEQAVNAIKNYVSQAGILCTDAGYTNSYSLSASSPFTNPQLKTGCRVRFKTANPNTGASTITAFGGSAIACRKSDGITPLSANDIPSNIEVEFVYDGTYWVQVFSGNKATTTSQGISYLNNPVQPVNNGPSPNDTVGFVAGTFTTSAGNQIYLPTMDKKIQSSGSWTAGTLQNGLGAGARTANTFYRTYVIQNNSTGAYDILFSDSGSAPTVPSGYTNLGIMDYALIRVNGSNNIATSKWDVNDKRLVLGSGESITYVNDINLSTSGNAIILNTSEPLELVVRLYLSLTQIGGSDFSTYGSEQNANDAHDTVLIVTNNAYQIAGGGNVYTSDGRIYWKHFSISGGVGARVAKIKSIKIRS